MKTIYFKLLVVFFLVVILISSCQNKEKQKISRVNDNWKSLNRMFSDLNIYSNKTINIEEFSTHPLNQPFALIKSKPWPKLSDNFSYKKILIKDELLLYLSPNNFGSCNSIASKLSNKNSNSKYKLIPDDINTYCQLKMANDSAFKTVNGIKDIANSFYIKKDNIESPLLIASEAITEQNFNLLNYIDSTKTGNGYLFYSLDLTGFLSLVAKANLGIGNNEISTSVKNNEKSSKSIALYCGWMDSPLFLAYKGKGKFNSDNASSNEKVNIIKNRINVLTAIDNEINELNPDSIFICSNYQLILAFIQNIASQNGSLDLNSNVGFNFGVSSISGSTNGNVSISKNSILEINEVLICDRNNGHFPIAISYATFSQMLNQLKTALNNK